MTPDLDLAAWIGRRRTQHDRFGATPVQALHATLDHDDGAAAEGMPLPPLWHWLYFLPLHRAREIGSDGHARRGDFLPPVPLPRRMWAGSRFEFHAPLRVGDARQPGEPEAPAQPAPADATWQRELVPDDVLLFRYSALTFNGHRIHHDRRYATEVEGCPGLVVHGPLIATLLLDLLQRHEPGAGLPDFRFRALRPCSDGRPLRLNGRRDGAAVRLWAQDGDGWLAMDASAMLR